MVVGIEELLGASRADILRVAARHGALNVRVFGSVARGEASAQSDLNLLVDAGPGTTPWFPGGLASELEELLGRRVDIVTDQALRPSIRERILDEAVPL